MSSSRSTLRSNFRTAVVAVIVTSFSIAALCGVVVLLSGASLDGAPGQVLWTTLVVGVTSLALLCNLSTAETPYLPVGLLGGLTTVTTAVISLVLVWTDQDGDNLWQAWGVSAMLAFSLAQVCLLLVVSRGATSRVRSLLVPTLVAIAWTTGHVCVLILGADGSGDASWRILGVAAIADVLGTVVIGALARAGRRTSAPSRVTVPDDVAEAVRAYAERTGSTPEAVLREAVRALPHAP